jgi:hypothetical protein
LAVPTWLKDKRSLLRTKELVNSARPQDRVKVIRGTNQKNQLEQEAWKIVIKIMILKKTMQEEEEREEQKIMMAASDAGTLDAAAASSTDDDLGNASCPSGAHDPHGSSPQDARSRGTFFGDDGASVVGRGGSASRSHASGSSIISRTGSASGGGVAGDAVAVLDGSFGRTNSSAAAVAKLFSRAGSSFKAHKGSSLVKLRVLIKEKILSTKAKYERWGVGPQDLEPIIIKDQILMTILMIVVTAGQRRNCCSFCKKRVIDSNQTQLGPSP